MRVDVFTIFPAYLEGPLSSSPLGRARERGLLDVRVHDPREHTTDPHRSVDHTPFGSKRKLSPVRNVQVSASTVSVISPSSTSPASSPSWV